MCGRYVVKTPIKTIAKMQRVFDAPLFELRYNVAPTQTVPIVRAKKGGRELTLVPWSLENGHRTDVLAHGSETGGQRPSSRQGLQVPYFDCLVRATRHEPGPVWRQC